MIDLKPIILTALRDDPVLSALVGKDKNKKHVKVYEIVAPEGTVCPYINFYELVNFDRNYADNKATGAEIHIHIDIWANSSTTNLALETNRIMESLGFTRTYAPDLYEKDTQIYHKILRYSKIADY